MTTMPDKRCGTCRWHQHEVIGGGGVCMNDRSDFFCDWTDDDFKCEKWEANET